MRGGEVRPVPDYPEFRGALVPLAAGEAAEGDQPDQGDDQPDPEAPDDHQHDPDDHEDAPQRDSADAGSSICPAVHLLLRFVGFWTSASIQRVPRERQNYSGSGSSSPGHLPVSLAKEVRLPWSTRPLTRRKIAPSTASAAISFGQANSRCSGFGGSSSSISPQTCSKIFLPTRPAIRPRTMLIGAKTNFIG